jgi:hypothetical protein
MDMQSKEEKQQQGDKDFQTALLTNTELQWLLGNIHVSKSFEHKMKSSIRRKIQTLTEIELPLLFKNNFVCYDEDCHDIKGKTMSLGRDLDQGSPLLSPISDTVLGKAKVPGPNPGQGFVLFNQKEQESPFFTNANYSKVLPQVVRLLPNTVIYIYKYEYIIYSILCH